MKEFRNILMIVNPISGGRDKDQMVNLIKNKAKETNKKLSIFKTTGNNDLSKIKKELQKVNPDRLFVIGGDGTIKIVAEAIHDYEIPLAIFPEGSANGLSLNLKIPENKKEQLNIAFGDNTTNLDVLHLNNEVCLHLSDIGLNAELIEHYESSSVRGKFGYLMQSIPTLIKSKYPYEFTIEANGETHTSKGIMLAIANCRKYGTGAVINPEGNYNDGIFEIITFKNLDIPKILGMLRDNVQLDPQFAKVLQTNQATISCPTPLAFQIDGEFIGKSEKIKAEISKKNLQILVNNTQ
ncbi:diacylglycerol/lipid kinase family protein [Zunongwangia sp.]|uniref:diacylglycerol/lipid kinase family protein n=1 Tax=Zunongwangia sp. TaxID=1965325 RepID=UPI003AA7C810